MIVLDTSVLVDAFAGERRSLTAMRRAVSGDERFAIPTLALSEWLRGPREPDELDDLELVLPAERLAFGPREAEQAASLYRLVPRGRQRQIDLGIAAHALLRDAAVWTLNRRDFEDIPGLRLYRPHE